MKKSFIQWHFLLIFLLAPAAWAMTDQRGTDFWVGFPADSYPTTVDTLEILITSANGAGGQVDVPGIGYSSPFTVPAGGSIAITLPHNALVTIGDGTTAQGVHVTSSSLVSVYGMDYEPATTDGYLALPTVADGTGYYDLSYNSSVSWTQGSSFLVVGTQNSTSVTINPVITVGARTAGVPYTVTLNQGDTYQLLAPTPGTDLSGSSINSDKPIAVFGACQIADIPVSVGQGNYLVEQLWPLVDWGTDFFTRPFATGSVSYRYLASVDNTTVNVNGAFFATLNAGQFVEQGAVSQVPKEVAADHPIYVMEYGYGIYYGNGNADPSMATVPPVDHWTNQYFFPEDLNAYINPTHYVNLVVPASAINNGVTLDGTPIPSFNYQPINGGPYYSFALPVSFSSPHSLTSAVSFMALPYMMDLSDAYSFPGGGLFVDNGPTPTPIPSPTPFVPNPCKVLVYYDGEPGAASVTNLVNLLQLEGAVVTTLPVTTTTYNPAADNWNNYGQVWDARFMPFTSSFGLNYDYVNPNWVNCMVNHLRLGGKLFLAAESDVYSSRNVGLGDLLRQLGVVGNSFVSNPDSVSNNYSQGNDSSLGQVTLPSTLPGAPNFFGDVVGGIPLAKMTDPTASLVHMATGWTHVNEDRSIVQGWSGAAQLPGAAGANTGKLLMVWDTDMWTPGDYSGVNGTTTNNFFTQVFYWLGGSACGGATPTPFGINTPTATPTASPTGTITPTLSVSPTSTPSSTPTDSPTPTGSWTLTATPTATGTLTLPPTLTPSFTPTLSPTSTWTTTPSGTPTFTATPTPTPNCQMHLWPNPFDPRRAFNHALKFGCLPLGARVSIYTISGEWVGDAQTVAPDEAQWNGSNQNGAPASAGIYFYLIQNGSTMVDKGKLLLVR